jgi:uncharacterized protein DUF3307
MSDPVLVLCWLVLAHLVADFVFQNDWIAGTKSRSDRRAWLGLLVHGAIVGVCLVPVMVAFGARGLGFLAVVTVSHILIDRWKVSATRRAEARALAAAHRRRGDTSRRAAPAAGLGSAWTPTPAIHYILDQALHLLVTAAAWAVFLASTSLETPFSQAVDGLLGSWDRNVVHHVTLIVVVVASLLIANTKGAFYLVATLVHPRELVEGTPEPPDPQPAPATPVAPPPAHGYRFRMGPVVATVEPAVTPTAPAEPLALTSSAPAPMSPPARIGATIGVLERLLIVTFVLTGSTVAIGFVIAAKTLARFKQLDDRGFAEYYLLGTLASVGVALGTALLASAALDTIR